MARNYKALVRSINESKRNPQERLDFKGNSSLYRGGTYTVRVRRGKQCLYANLGGCLIDLYDLNAKDGDSAEVEITSLWAGNTRGAAVPRAKPKEAAIDMKKRADEALRKLRGEEEVDITQFIRDEIVKATDVIEPIGFLD